MAVGREHETTADAPPRTAWLYDPAIRGLIAQALLLIVIVALGYELFSNASANLKKQNVASGFDFLGQPAGFEIIQTLIPYSAASSYGRAFFVGLLNTIVLAAFGIVLATILGFLIGIARLSSNWLVSTMAGAYVEVMRNIPLLLHIFIWYFAALRALPDIADSIKPFSWLGLDVFLNNRGLYSPKPIFGDGASLVLLALALGVIAALVLRSWAARRQKEAGTRFLVLWPSIAMVVALPLLAYVVAGMPIGFEAPKKGAFNFVGGMVVIPEFMALLAALSTYTAAYIAENVRSGIMAVSHGQSEAALSLGLTRGQTLRFVVVPQAMRVIIPPLTNQYLNLTKNSSLAAAIAYPDLVSVFAGTVLNQAGQAVEIILITMAVYLALSLITSAFMGWYNARIALVER